MSEYEIEARKRKVRGWKAEQERLQRLIDSYQLAIEEAESTCESN